MARAAAVLVLAALAVAAVDLAHKALVISERGGAVLSHERSSLYVGGVVAVSLVWGAAIVLTRSAAIALGGGVVAGGAAGNVLSLAFWPSLPGVPDPLIAAGVAFNLADLAVGLGLALVLVATATYAVRNRGRLHQPVRLRSS